MILNFEIKLGSARVNRNYSNEKNFEKIR